MMTKKGECKTGLSTYYVRIKHCQDVFIRIMKRLSSMPRIKELPGIFKHESPTQGTGVWTVSDDTKLLAKQVEELHDFLTYSYSAKHLKLEDGMKCHCCKFARSDENLCCPTPILRSNISASSAMKP
jgi:hypothetical protein